MPQFQTDRLRLTYSQLAVPRRNVLFRAVFEILRVDEEVMHNPRQKRL